MLATGDDTLVREAEATVPGITTVGVKRALANRAAESLHPDEACARIEAGAHLTPRRVAVHVARSRGPAARSAAC